METVFAFFFGGAVTCLVLYLLFKLSGVKEYETEKEPEPGPHPEW